MAAVGRDGDGVVDDHDGAWADEARDPPGHILDGRDAEEECGVEPLARFPAACIGADELDEVGDATACGERFGAREEDGEGIDPYHGAAQAAGNLHRGGSLPATDVEDPVAFADGFPREEAGDHARGAAQRVDPCEERIEARKQARVGIDRGGGTGEEGACVVGSRHVGQHRGFVVFLRGGGHDQRPNVKL